MTDLAILAAAGVVAVALVVTLLATGAFFAGAISKAVELRSGRTVATLVALLVLAVFVELFAVFALVAGVGAVL